MNNDQLLTLLAVSCSVLFLLITVFVVSFIHNYRKKQHQHHFEKTQLHQQFESAKLQSQREITEQTLQNIAQEIHDNVGQRLTLASLYLEQLQCSNEELRAQAAELLEQGLNDLRNLSRSLSGGYILEKGLELALEHEAALITASGKMKCSFECTGERHYLNEQQEIILFRCTQEMLNNAVKHSGGSLLKIELHQSTEHVSLTIDDNGKGINISDDTMGVGLQSVQQRVALLCGTCTFTSKMEGGTLAKFDIPTPQTI